MNVEPTFTPPATYSAGSTFWRLASDGRIVWVDDDGVARDAIGLVVPVSEVLRDGARVTEGDFRMALVTQDRSSPMRLPSGELIGGRKLKLARYAIPPVSARGDPPWASRNVRMFPVMDGAGTALAEIRFEWKAGAWHLGRSTFVAAFEARLRYGECGQLSLAAEEHDWATLDAFHPIALPWYCRSCRRLYAQERWRVSEMVSGDDSAKMGYRGTCPRGHDRLIATQPTLGQ